jgi:hypothetical protein
MDKKRIDVCISEGKLSGVIEESVFGDSYVAFRGIPYAKPPIGELRFKVISLSLFLFFYLSAFSSVSDEIIL